jgi:hypothetical protein
MFPPPSLHVALMRSDPWNEFIGKGQPTADDLLKFKSCSNDPASEMRQKVFEQLTVISGIGPEIPPPPTMTSDIVSKLRDNGSRCPGGGRRT